MDASFSTILRRILAAGLIAGLVAGSVTTVVQRFQIAPLILAAEVFEDEDVAAHDADAAAAGQPAGQAHETAAAEAWSPANGLQRIAFTWLANVLTGTGFGLILAAAIALAGRPVDRRRGVVWGLAGFAAFSLAPALGLPPELPGMMAADLAARQLWWLGAAGGTAAGLALLILTPDTPLKRPLQAAGLLLLILPHLIGAPHTVAQPGPLPAELAARFVVASLAASALFWVILGSVAGQLLARLLPAPGQAPRKPVMA